MGIHLTILSTPWIFEMLCKVAFENSLFLSFGFLFQVQYVIQGYHKRREYIAAFLSHFGT